MLGCQTSYIPPPEINYDLLNDSKFAIQPVETQAEIFILSEEVKIKLNEYIKDTDSTIRHTKQLLNFLMNNGDESLAYQSGANLVASEAFYN